MAKKRKVLGSLEELGEQLILSFEKLTPKQRADSRKAMYESVTGKRAPAILTLTEGDVQFLRDCGISTRGYRKNRKYDHVPLDGTQRRMLEMGLPMTRANYLHVAFLGNPPAEPLDGELEAELPEMFQDIEDSEE